MSWMVRSWRWGYEDEEEEEGLSRAVGGGGDGHVSTLTRNFRIRTLGSEEKEHTCSTHVCMYTQSLQTGKVLQKG